MIKRRPKLSWFINFLAISLIALLIANSVLNSIYINNLKNRMADITDNYFLAEQKLQTAIESLVQTRISLLKYIILLKTEANQEDFSKAKLLIQSEFQKNEINLSSILLSLQKKEINRYMGKPISDLYISVTQYLFTIENMFASEKPNDLAAFMVEVDKTNVTYFKIKENLRFLSEILRQKALNVKNSDNLVKEYLPSISLASFFIALIIGGSFIYVSRREVRKSILDETTEILTEAYQYQRDCVQTLEICKEMTESGLNELKNASLSLINERAKQELEEIIRNFAIFTHKVHLAFETRTTLHNKEITHIEESQKSVKNLEKQG